MSDPPLARRITRAFAAAVVCLTPAACATSATFTRPVPDHVSASVADALGDGVMHVHVITDSRAVTAVLHGMFRGPRFSYSEEVPESPSALPDEVGELCAALERSGAELLIVASDRVEYPPGEPEAQSLPSHGDEGGRRADEGNEAGGEPPAEPRNTACAQDEATQLEMRQRAAAEVVTDVQLVTGTVCAGSLAERRLPARLSVSPEQLRAQLTRLLQGSQVARTTGGWASVQLTPGASPAVGDEARAVGPGTQDNTTGMVTRVAEGRAEVVGLWPDRPYAAGDHVFFGGPLWSFSFTPEVRVSVPNAVNLGVDFEVFRTHHGPLMGIGLGWLVGVGDAARVGGSGAHIYGGYLLWLSPTRFGLYLRGDAGLGGAKVWGTEKPFGHVGIAAGLKWRVPSVMVLDASGGYDIGTSVTLGPEGSARPLSFAWHGPSARLTFAIDNQLLPRGTGSTEQMPCITVGCDEHAR
ncbi:uncharacterized protein SOCE26_103970 [Sorangium cellulosum]|uniref:Secreted protein n=1 Tax=Sorangium cellulosum TaxID=56 RepID=A0A2L0FBC2_SORCE|nr:hypothetical protein [Sorangium cellulosum]AUX48854.1 uncharacterized protein SOCE26_103970 [Sorangium cellulosum]